MNLQAFVRVLLHGWCSHRIIALDWVKEETWDFIGSLFQNQPPPKEKRKVKLLSCMSMGRITSTQITSRGFDIYKVVNIVFHRSYNSFRQALFQHWSTLSSDCEVLLYPLKF
jgi:hypothetical protein